MVAPLYPRPMLDESGEQVTIMGFPCVLVDWQVEMAKQENERKLAEQIETLSIQEAEMKYGYQPDGSLLLPPKAVQVLREVMLRRTEGHIRLPNHRVTAYLHEFAEVLYDECGVEFEELT